MGVLLSIGYDQVAGVGGKPNADWTGLETPPPYYSPLMHRGPKGDTTKSISIRCGRENLNVSFKEGDKLRPVREQVLDMLVAHGMDTMA
jgi:hypothetical protein